MMRYFSEFSTDVIHTFDYTRIIKEKQGGVKKLLTFNSKFDKMQYRLNHNFKPE